MPVHARNRAMRHVVFSPAARLLERDVDALEVALLVSIVDDRGTAVCVAANSLALGQRRNDGKLAVACIDWRALGKDISLATERAYVPCQRLVVESAHVMCLGVRCAEVGGRRWASAGRRCEIGGAR